MLAGLAMLFFLPWPVGVFASTVIVAIGISFNYPSLMAMVVDTVPEQERVRAISTFTMFFEIGTACGALVLGTVADLTSKRAAHSSAVPSSARSASWCCGRSPCRDPRLHVAV